MSLLLSTTRQAFQTAQGCRLGSLLARSLSSIPPSVTPVYTPKLVKKRSNEAGAGGKGSESGVKVALFGARGLLGTLVCHELGGNGFMGYIANRGDDMEMRHLKPCFELGRTRFVFYSPKDRDSVREVIADADIVVNMIGKRWETWQPIQTKTFPYIGKQVNYSFHDANVKIPKMLAELCLEMQVDHFVHVSSASANPNSKSEWSRTKYEGEQAVREIYPWATIIRPTQMFGDKDFFLHWFPSFRRRYKMLPLIDGGKTLVQPVFAHDVAQAILRVCDAPYLFEGRRIDCFGPSDYTYAEIAEFCGNITEQYQESLDFGCVYVPKFIAKAVGEFHQRFTVHKLLTSDWVEVMTEPFTPAMTPQRYAAQKDDENKIYTLADLDIQAKSLESQAFQYLQHYRRRGVYARTPGFH